MAQATFGRLINRSVSVHPYCRRQKNSCILLYTRMLIYTIQETRTINLQDRLSGVFSEDLILNSLLYSLGTVRYRLLSAAIIEAPTLYGNFVHFFTLPPAVSLTCLLMHIIEDAMVEMDMKSISVQLRG